MVLCETRILPPRDLQARGEEKMCTEKVGMWNDEEYVGK